LAREGLGVIKIKISGKVGGKENTMCQFCERKTSIGWHQPPLEDVCGNILDDHSQVVIHDYQTAPPELLVELPALGKRLWGEGVGMIYIPIHFCPVCGRELGKKN